jgi:lipoate-protein ligase A
LITGVYLENSKAIISKIKDPYFNLALENYYLENINPNSRILLVWDNSPCVVIGRFQNPWIECNLKSMSENNIEFVRRQSGGGTVYHDSGNINFSVIADKTLHNKEWNHDFIIKSLAIMKVSAHATKRGDIRLTEKGNRKISGSAFKEKKRTAFHHGTMLINSDLDSLNNYIHSNKQDLESKSISSVRSVVGNISEKNSLLNAAIVSEAFCESFLNELQINDSIVIDSDSKLAHVILNSDYYKKLKSHLWRYGETPKFFVNTSFKNWNIELTIKKTKIMESRLENSSIHPSFLESLEKSMIGVSVFDMKIFIFSVEHFSNFEDELKEFGGWFCDYFYLNFLP